jgi:hypothetical protein
VTTRRAEGAARPFRARSRTWAGARGVASMRRAR